MFAGTRLAEAPRLSRSVLALSGAVLIAISLLWVLPEVAARQGWPAAAGWTVLGFVALAAVDRFVYPICPACAHTHDHNSCSTPLHGFAPPLLIAIGMHSFLDGWGLAAAREASGFVQIVFLLGISLHKFPEGLALGAIVRSSMASHAKSLLACVMAESLTVAGGLSAVTIEANLSGSWVGVLLAVASGTFLYLGYHAIEGEFHRRRVARMTHPRA